MKTHWVDKPLGYDGTQLRSLFGYLDYGILGDSIVAFEGPCSISFEHMLDGEDLRAQSPIAGDRMVHFVVEKFQASLLSGVALQRLLASLCLELVRETVVGSGRVEVALALRRDGDDVYWGDRKLSISIATATPVSSLIHFAVNSVGTGAPVPICCLRDFAIDSKTFAQELCARFAREVISIEEATRKVRWAR